MISTCILTDSTVCFTRSIYPGQELVHLVPWSLQSGDQIIPDGFDISILRQFIPGNDLPPLQAITPSVETFQRVFNTLGETYHDIVVILISSHLCLAVKNAIQATALARSPASIHIVDSFTSAAGLGLLVQSAAEALQRGLSAGEVSRLVRGLTRRIYAVFCLPDLSFLARAGLLDPAQAVIGEMLGILPLYNMENGALLHTNKIRSTRHMVDIVFEFIAEFDHLRHLALLQGLPFFDLEGRNIRERIHQNIRTVPFSEHTLPLSLATLLGPRAIGLMAFETSLKEL